MMLEGCREGRHDECKQSLTATFYDERSKSFIATGVTYECKCAKRGCPCFVKASERKAKTRKRKS